MRMDGQVETLSLSAIANAAAAAHIGMQGQTMLDPLTGNDRPACMFSMTSPIANLTTTTPNSKVSRSMKESARELMNCKRRLDFNHANYLPYHRPPTVSVARRNERERNRVKLINMTFATLRQHLPRESKGSKSKKMSKVETLRAAIEYIRYLQELVDDNDSVNSVFDSSCLTATLTAAGQLAAGLTAGLTAAGLTAAGLSAAAAGLTSGLYSNTTMSSPRPSSCSDSSYEGLSAEEEELLDFTNWF